MTRPVILTGLRANSSLTIGNYFGGIVPTVAMAQQVSDDYIVNMFIPDLHSITTPINYSELQANIMMNARVYAAAGLPLDNPNVRLYRQSYISAHSELTWILDCFTGMGEMSRMTQFKDKTRGSDEARVSVGLFNYPILMAADILLYNATYVPVGDDQTQHLEFARDIAERFNASFNDELFTVPKPVADQHRFFGREKGLRIKDLVHPTAKMSKSDETGRGVIYLDDTPAQAAKKIMSATTDDMAQVRYQPDTQPGVSNLIELLSLLKNQSIKTTLETVGGMTRYGDFKRIVATEMETFLASFQDRLAAVDDERILTTLRRSEDTVETVAQATLKRAQVAVGLRPSKD